MLCEENTKLRSLLVLHFNCSTIFSAFCITVLVVGFFFFIVFICYFVTCRNDAVNLSLSRK